MHSMLDDENRSNHTTLPRRAHHGDLATTSEPPAETTRPHRPFSHALVYHLESIEKARPPGVDQGRDWYRYVLRNDNSVIQGFRRGSRQHVAEYVARYAEQLNTRTVLGPSPWSSRQKNPLRPR